jgi:Uma2 family endonuclease
MVSPRLVELQSGRKDTVINPILIVDVLSDSTKACDRDEKFAAYRTIAIVQEYLLIDQSQYHSGAIHQARRESMAVYRG